MKINNKGFTLIEVLAVVVIIALLGLIAIPSVISTINKEKQTSYTILINSIITGSQLLYEEIDYNKTTINQFGNLSGIVTIKNNTIETNLQTLASNGFLTVQNSNTNTKNIINPITKKEIGNCKITITKTKNSNNIVKYEVKSTSSSNSDCPSEYKEVNND